MSNFDYYLKTELKSYCDMLKYISDHSPFKNQLVMPKKTNNIRYYERITINPFTNSLEFESENLYLQKNKGGVK